VVFGGKATEASRSATRSASWTRDMMCSSLCGIGTAARVTALLAELGVSGNAPG